MRVLTSFCNKNTLPTPIRNRQKRFGIFLLLGRAFVCIVVDFVDSVQRIVHLVIACKDLVCLYLTMAMTMPAWMLSHLCLKKMVTKG